ncbi:hypothetical protein B0J17DRAFT_633269 [Rhizoctonia solani]|nr:hypothetical protein B0J17DRAFT_633269 [Rhizoctonia solani]
MLVLVLVFIFSRSACYYGIYPTSASSVTDTYNGINYRPYAGETDLPAIMALVQDALTRHLVELSIDAMTANGADDMSVSISSEIQWWTRFVREKRLFRFYMNRKDAFRLIKPL